MRLNPKTRNGEGRGTPIRYTAAEAIAVARAISGSPVDSSLMDALPEPTAACVRETINAAGDKVAAFLTTAQAHSLPKPDEFLSEAQQINPNLMATETQDNWDRYTLADAYAPRPPLTFLVDGLFQSSTLSIMYGAPGTLKSLLLADLCICVAAGLSWLPPLMDNDVKEIHTTQANTMWIDFDNGIRRTHERFGALGCALRLPPDIPLSYYSMPSPWLDAGDADSVGELRERIIKNSAGLVVIDNLGVITGDAEENSSKIASVMSNLRRLVEQTGAAIVLVHHQRKNNGNPARAGDSLRGHSSIEAAVDLALHVERDDGSESVTVKATKARGEMVIPFAAQFTHESGANLHELSQARFFGIEVDDDSSDRAIDSAIFTILGHKRPMNQSELVKAVRDALPRAGVNRIRSALSRMVSSDGKLMSTSGKHGARMYDFR